MVNMGYETASASAVWDGAFVPDSTSLLPIDSSPDGIAQAVGKVIEISCQADDRKQSVLMRNVVLVGKSSI